MVLLLLDHQSNYLHVPLSAAVSQSHRSSESAKSVKRLSKVYSTAAGPSCSIILNRILLEITRVSNRHYEIRIEINPCLPDVTKKAKNKKKPIHLHFQPTKHFVVNFFIWASCASIDFTVLKCVCAALVGRAQLRVSVP